MPAPLRLRLDDAARAELAGRFEATGDAATRTRYQLLLLLAEGQMPSAVWTTRLLAEYLAGATGHRAVLETVRLALHRAGCVCKRPGWSLKRKAHEQPAWAKTGSGWRRS
jgi:transposase